VVVVAAAAQPVTSENVDPNSNLDGAANAGEAPDLLALEAHALRVVPRVTEDSAYAVLGRDGAVVFLFRL
jgi:hypothetical protein